MFLNSVEYYLLGRAMRIFTQHTKLIQGFSLCSSETKTRELVAGKHAASHTWSLPLGLHTCKGLQLFRASRSRENMAFGYLPFKTSLKYQNLTT